MSLFKALKFLKPRNPQIQIPPRPIYLSSISRRTLSIFPLIEHRTESEADRTDEAEKNPKMCENKNKLRLDVFFKEAVGLSEKSESRKAESEIASESNELKRELMELEREVKELKANSKGKGKENLKKQREIKKVRALEENSNPKSLYAVFTKNNFDTQKITELNAMRREREVIIKEFSPEMEMFVNYLYKEGYFKDANFLPRDRLDYSCFENSYGRDFIKFAAVRFGQDHQEIAKWLSGKELKKVALFGCPSLERRNVFSAKRLRTFFAIQEDTVCSKCMIRESCKFVNQSVWKGDTKNLNLATVMRIITLYALELVPPRLAVPDEVKASACKLLVEAMNLSQTIS